MRPGLTISIGAHAVALGLSLVALSAQPMDSPQVASLPVSFISDKDFSQLTQGVKNAPKPEIKDPKPLADKVDTPKPIEQTADKVGKQDIKTETAAAKQPPQPDPKPPEKTQKPPPDYKPDQIAQLLKKDANKQPPKPDPKPTPDKPQKDAPKFNADQVAQLLDHREPQRQVAAAEAVNQNANLGSATGTSAQLSQSEIDALRARISSCWSPPPGIDVNTKVYIVLDVQFRPDANMVHEPAVVEGSASALGPALAESARRALLKCQPFTMLKPEHYDQWKDLQLKFDPQELLGG
jgi:hypothetical protein